MKNSAKSGLGARVKEQVQKQVKEKVRELFKEFKNR